MLSPVARIERPIRVFRNQLRAAQIRATRIRSKILLDQSPSTVPSNSLPQSEKRVSVPKIETFEEKPMTPRFTV